MIQSEHFVSGSNTHNRLAVFVINLCYIFLIYYNLNLFNICLSVKCNAVYDKSSQLFLWLIFSLMRYLLFWDEFDLDFLFANNERVAWVVVNVNKLQEFDRHIYFDLITSIYILIQNSNRHCSAYNFEFIYYTCIFQH